MMKTIFLSMAFLSLSMPALAGGAACPANDDLKDILTNGSNSKTKYSQADIDRMAGADENWCLSRMLLSRIKAKIGDIRPLSAQEALAIVQELRIDDTQVPQRMSRYLSKKEWTMVNAVTIEVLAAGAEDALGRNSKPA